MGLAGYYRRFVQDIHVDEEAVESALAVSSLRSGKTLPDPYKDHPFHQGQKEEEETPIIVEQDTYSEDEEEQVTAEPNPDKYKPPCALSSSLKLTKSQE